MLSFRLSDQRVKYEFSFSIPVQSLLWTNAQWKTGSRENHSSSPLTRGQGLTLLPHMRSYIDALVTIFLMSNG